MSESLTQKTVLRLLSAAMFQKSFSTEKEVDWKAVFDECRENNTEREQGLTFLLGELVNKVALMTQWMNNGIIS